MLNESEAFTFEQRHRMSLAVSAHMRGDDQAMVTTSSTDRNGKKAQKNLSLHHYATEKRWTLWQDKLLGWDAKLEDGMDFLLEIGCSYPSDDTLRVMVAILAICSKRVITPDASYGDMRLCRNKLVNKRKLLGSNVNYTEVTFPKDVNDFVLKHPYIYREGAPPIASLIDDNTINDVTRPDRMPARQSNKALKKQPGGLKPVKEAPQDDATLAALRYVLHGAPLPAPSIKQELPSSSHSHAPFYGMPPNAKAESLKLKDEFMLPLPSMAATTLKTPVESDTDLTIDKMIADANCVIAKKSKTKKQNATAKAKGKKTKKSIGDQIDDAFCDDDAEESGDEETEVEESDDEYVNKRPARKQPAGAYNVLKKPAAACVKKETNGGKKKTKTLDDWAAKDHKILKQPVFATLFDPKEVKDRSRGAYTSRAFHTLGKSQKLHRLSRLAYAIAAKIWDKVHKKK
jgi:hypothetical protein